MPVDVQLRGFPEWTEKDDLQYVVDECGYPTMNMKINSTGKMQIAEVSLPSWEAADSVVNQLNGFEFTPGYPLQVRLKPGQQRPAAAAQGGGGYAAIPASSHTGYGSGGSSHAGDNAKPQIPTQSDSEYSVTNCIGAGRIEGWFVQGKPAVESKGWGHVQSYSFEGNLVFRHQLSPLLKSVDYEQKAQCTFEVVMVKGQPEAVRMALEGQDAAAPGDDNLVQEYEEQDERENKPSYKSQKRREREEADGRVLFFGGFGSEVDEDCLWKFAEQAGTVKKVKLFYNTETWTSKGCGKVNYATAEAAEYAVNELSGTILNDRVCTIEPLGQPSGNAPKRPKQQPPAREDRTHDAPKQLPLSMFSDTDGPQEKLQICIAAFEDLLANHDPVASGFGMIFMIRNLVMEVNDIFGSDTDTLQMFATQLRKYSWFRENAQMVKWQASRQRVNISKVSTPLAARPDRRAEREAEVEQRKALQEMMGKPIFQMPDKPPEYHPF